MILQIRKNILTHKWELQKKEDGSSIWTMVSEHATVDEANQARDRYLYEISMPKPKEKQPKQPTIGKEKKNTRTRK